MGKVSISFNLVQQVLAAAAASPDQEVCGLLLGAPGRIDAVQPARNVAASLSDNFEIDPAVLIAAHRAQRAGGPLLLGCYHSHPGGDPNPSPRDAAAAEPGSLWLIVGQGRARLWRAEPGGFREVPIATG